VKFDYFQKLNRHEVNATRREQHQGLFMLSTEERPEVLRGHIHDEGKMNDNQDFFEESKNITN
jgi:hypothetical protein